MPRCSETCTTQPLVSVIIPNYNHASFLRQRLDSVLCQSYRSVEIILLDDASTDSSVEILREFLSEPSVIDLFCNGENSGSPVAQWQRGLELSRGELVWIAESDDFSSPEFLERMVDEVFRHDADLAYCNSCIVDDQGKTIDMMSYASPHFSADRWLTAFSGEGNDEIRKYLAYRNTIPNVSAVLFRRRALESSIGSGRDFYYAGDWRVYLELLSNARLAYVDEPLNYFREHHASTRDFSCMDSQHYVRERLLIHEYLYNRDVLTAQAYSELCEESRRIPRDREDLLHVTQKLINKLSSGVCVTIWGYSYMTRVIVSLLIDAGYRQQITQIVDRRAIDMGWRYMGIPVCAPKELEREDIGLVFISSLTSTDSIRDDVSAMFTDVPEVLDFNEVLNELTVSVQED